MISVYKPGQGVRFTVTSTNASGALFDPDVMALTLHQLPPGNGTITAPSPTHDSTGQYHADVLIPMNVTPGTWVARWQATGAAVGSNALVEYQFTILPLSF